MAKRAIYTAMDIQDIDPVRDIGLPGAYPYTRGIHETMYRGRLWTMRQFAGFGTAEQTNKRFHMLLAKGQTGLSTAFDTPTLLGFDSSNPGARGDIGMGGVAIDTLADMDRLFAEIDLARVSTSMTINGPAIVLLAMYFELARSRGILASVLRGTTQNDPLKEFTAQNEWIIPPAASVKLLVDTIEYCAHEAQQWNPVSISGYHIREAGATAVQEVAFTLADGICYVEQCIVRGMDVNEFAPRLSFFFDFCNDWLEEIAKIRAARKLWARIMKERFGVHNARGQWMRLHIQTAGQTLTQEQPLNNIARVAIQALGAVLAGCQSLHANSLDEELSLASEEAVTVALRTQQIIAHESGIADVADPLGGSYAIECLTKDIEGAAEAQIASIDGMGGMIAAIESGWPQAQIRTSAEEAMQAFEGGTRIVVGKNAFVEGGVPNPSFRNIDPLAQEEQLVFLETVKRGRNGTKVSRALASLERAARAGENCMPMVCEAVAAHATEEEVCNVLRAVYGIYQDTVVL